MHRSKVALVAAAAALLLGAGYKPAPPGPDAATLVFQRGYAPGLTKGGAQNYALSSTGCRKMAFAAKFSAFTSKEPKSVLTPAGAPLYVFVNGFLARSRVDVATPGGVAVRQDMCSTAASFIPEAGHTYDVRQDAEACTLAVTDISTAAPPASLQVLDPRTCQPTPKA